MKKSVQLCAEDGDIANAIHSYEKIASKTHAPVPDVISRVLGPGAVSKWPSLPKDPSLPMDADQLDEIGKQLQELLAEEINQHEGD